MVMVFCDPDQARIEALDPLQLIQMCLIRAVVVVRRYSNTPCIPRGSSHSLYLDVDTLSGGAASTQFPLDRLHLCWLLSFSESEVLLPHGVGEEGLETYPYLSEFLWDSSDEGQHLSDPISLSVSMLAPSPHLEECT